MKYPSRQNKKIILVGLCLVLAYIALGSSKVIYINLQNSYGNLYNPAKDLAAALISSVLLGSILGYSFKKNKIG